MTLMKSDLVPGRPFPDLTLPAHDGRPTRLGELARGYPLVVTFYRGWW